MKIYTVFLHVFSTAVHTRKKFGTNVQNSTVQYFNEIFHTLISIFKKMLKLIWFSEQTYAVQLEPQMNGFQ